MLTCVGKKQDGTEGVDSRSIVHSTVPHPTHGVLLIERCRHPIVPVRRGQSGKAPQRCGWFGRTPHCRGQSDGALQRYGSYRPILIIVFDWNGKRLAGPGLIYLTMIIIGLSPSIIMFDGLRLLCTNPKSCMCRTPASIPRRQTLSCRCVPGGNGRG